VVSLRLAALVLRPVGQPLPAGRGTPRERSAVGLVGRMRRAGMVPLPHPRRSFRMVGRRLEYRDAAGPRARHL